MTTETNTTALAAVEAAFARATGQWTDMTWDGLSAVVDALERAEAKSESAVERAWDDMQQDGLTSWYIGEGPATAEYQEHRRRLAEAVAERDLADLRELAAEEGADVEAAAERAQEWAELAMQAARVGKWDEAVEAARKAAGVERTYGDAPTWGPFEAACLAAQEMDGLPREYVIIDGETIGIDTDDEQAAAEALLAERGIGSTPVYRGHGPDQVKTSLVLFARVEDADAQHA